MSKKENKNLERWIGGNSELPSEEIQSIWDLSEKYKSGYKPNVEKGLSRLKAKMRKADQGADNVVPMRSTRRGWLRVAATIVLIMAIGFTWRSYFYNPMTNELTEVNQQKEILLADGTKVVLNQNSQLVFPESFEGNNRKVRLTGEAYFNVSHNPDKPFLIQTEEATVKVLGTSFNVRAYPSESFTEVEVESGKVAFNLTDSKNQVILTANEKGYYQHDQKLVKSAVPFTNAQAWRTGELRFKDLGLQEAINLVERRYAVEISLSEAIKECKFTSNFDQGTTLEEVFTSMERVLSVKVASIENGTYKISGSGCK